MEEEARRLHAKYRGPLKPLVMAMKIDNTIITNNQLYRRLASAKGKKPTQDKRMVLSLENQVALLETIKLYNAARYPFRLQALIDAVSSVADPRSQKAEQRWLKQLLQREGIKPWWKTGKYNSPKEGKDFSYVDIDIFLDVIEETLAKEKFQSENVYTLDETPAQGELISFSEGANSPSKSPVRHNGMVVSDLKTIIPICNAAGKLVHLVQIWSDPRSETNQCKLAIPELVGTRRLNRKIDVSDFVSEKGYSTNLVFPNMIRKVFTPIRAAAGSAPILLLMDNHKSHVCLETMRACKELQITVCMLPANTTHFIQPADNNINGNYKKTLYESILKDYNSQLKKKNVHDLAAMAKAIKKAAEEALTPKVIISSFANTGIWPFNRNLILKRAAELKPLKYSDKSPPFLRTLIEKVQSTTPLKPVHERRLGITEHSEGYEPRGDKILVALEMKEDAKKLKAKKTTEDNLNRQTKLRSDTLIKFRSKRKYDDITGDYSSVELLTANPNHCSACFFANASQSKWWTCSNCQVFRLCTKCSTIGALKLAHNVHQEGYDQLVICHPDTEKKLLKMRGKPPAPKRQKTKETEDK